MTARFQYLNYDHEFKTAEIIFRIWMMRLGCMPLPYLRESKRLSPI